MADVQCQAEIPTSSCDYQCQAPKIFNLPANICNVEKDHAYAQKKPPLTSSPRKAGCVIRSFAEENDRTISDIDVDDPKDAVMFMKSCKMLKNLQIVCRAIENL